MVEVKLKQIRKDLSQAKKRGGYLVNVLVVGGAGYIGSHMVKILDRAGLAVTTLDNLSNGYRDAVVGGRFIDGDLANTGLLDQLFADGGFDGVMHFASF